ncbi:MAG: HEAT repeat domain-containing protein [Pseudomonadota bacterium]
MATIIAFPELAVQDAFDLELAFLDGCLPVSHATRREVVDGALAQAFDADLPIDQRLDLAGYLALAHGSHFLNTRVMPLLAAEEGADRQVAALALGYRGNLSAVFALVALLDDEDVDVQRTAVVALAGIRDHRVLSFLLGVLDRDDALVTTVLSALRLFPLAQTEPVYRRYLTSDHADVSLLALGAYLSLDAPDAVSVARRFLDHGDRRHRCLALTILEHHGQRRELELVLPLRRDSDPRVRHLVDELIPRLRDRH